MADTRVYGVAEDWVRKSALPRLFSQHFEKQFLPVGRRTDGTTAKHEFDAVSKDQTVVASIKALSGKTVGGRNPAGKISNANSELLFLSLVWAPRRLLVLTDKSFFELFRKKSDGKRPLGVELVHIPLPQHIRKMLERAWKIASRE